MLVAVSPQIVQIAQLGALDARIEMHDQVLDRHATERLTEVEHLALIFDLALAEDGVAQALTHPLDQVHQIGVVRVRLIQLQHRELGIVSGRHTLVAEVAIDLVHALEAADHQTLQIKLRRDAQIQIDVERVVMRDERPRHRAARDRLHHRRLDFQEVQRVEEIAQVLHQPRARPETSAGCPG